MCGCVGVECVSMWQIKSLWFSFYREWHALVGPVGVTINRAANPDPPDSATLTTMLAGPPHIRPVGWNCNRHQTRNSPPVNVGFEWVYTRDMLRMPNRPPQSGATQLLAGIVWVFLRHLLWWCDDKAPDWPIHPCHPAVCTLIHCRWVWNTNPQSCRTHHVWTEIRAIYSMRH